jgi:subtilisin family serine protease
LGLSACVFTALAAVSPAQAAADGSYIVVLKDGTRDMGAAAARLAGQVGTVGHIYDSALHGFSATMSESQARRMAADPSVAFIERDVMVSGAETQPDPPSWGLDRVDQRDLPLNKAYEFGTRAKNVTAYVIDCNGHGTHVAGTIAGAEYGVAKGTRIVGVRVLNCQGSGRVAGVDWVTKHAAKPAVANMSLGGASQALDSAVTRSISSGINTP